jgi:hypothetical protein
METTSRTTLARIALAGALFLAAGAAGCASKAAVPSPTSSTTSAISTPAVASPATPGAQPPVSAPPTVDAAGAAIGKSLTVGSAKPKAARPGGIARPTSAVAIGEAIRLLRKDQGIGSVRSISVRGMTQDKKGHWWILIAVTDATTGSNEAVVAFDGKTWDDPVFGQGITDDNLPPDVRF